MTRKDHRLLAEALRKVRESYAPHWDLNLFRAQRDCVLFLAEALMRDNPRFNRAQFLAAAGVEE
jgi:hypothetical protein